MNDSSKGNSPVLSDSPLSSTLQDSPGPPSQEDTSLATSKEEELQALRRQLEETERRLAESQRAVAQATRRRKLLRHGFVVSNTILNSDAPAHY